MRTLWCLAIAAMLLGGCAAQPSGRVVSIEGEAENAVLVVSTDRGRSEYPLKRYITPLLVTEDDVPWVNIFDTRRVTINVTTKGVQTNHQELEVDEVVRREETTR